MYLENNVGKIYYDVYGQEDAHHVANQDNPEGTNRILLDFLESTWGDCEVSISKGAS